MTDDFKEEIRARASGDPVDETIAQLKEWGATQIDTTRVADGASIDFYTPFPGNQPIKSTMTVTNGAVKESVIRYGVLSKADLGGHPATAILDERQPPEVNRLKRAVNKPIYPGSLRVGVDFGDGDRVPRPHVRAGYTGGATVHEGVEGEPTPVPDFINWIISVGEEVRAEFSEEFVEPVPGLQNAPRFITNFVDGVSGQWEIEEARPSSITNTEVSLTETLQDATVEFNEEGEVVRFSATFETSPLAGSVQSDESWRSTVDGVEFPPETTAFVREESGKREVNWDSARAGDTADADEIASALNSLSIRA